MFHGIFFDESNDRMALFGSFRGIWGYRYVPTMQAPRSAKGEWLTQHPWFWAMWQTQNASKCHKPSTTFKFIIGYTGRPVEMAWCLSWPPSMVGWWEDGRDAQSWCQTSCGLPDGRWGFDMSLAGAVVRTSWGGVRHLNSKPLFGS